MKQMWKHILTLVLTAVLVLGMMPGNAPQAHAEAYSGSCGENVTWKLDTETGVLTISGTGPMSDFSTGWSDDSDGYPEHPWAWNEYWYKITHVIIEAGVTTIGMNAFRGFEELESVTIADTVTTIGDCAFYNCSEKLTSITIPEGVKTIGNEAFRNCDSLTSVVISNSVNCIGSWAFEGCDNLSSIALPDSMNSIGQYAFSTTSLTSLTIPEGITKIEEGTFDYCLSLADITIPNSVTDIGDYSFRDCQSLTNIIIPDSVTTIGDGSFMRCSSLANIAIPASVTSIGVGLLSGCSSLTNISVDTKNPNYSSDGVCLFNKDKTELLEAAGGISGAYSIPDGVISFRHNVFNGHSELTSISIPDSLTGDIYSGPRHEFYECGSLETVLVGSGNPRYSSDGKCLYNKDKTELLIVPYQLAGDYTVPDGVDNIGNEQFAGCRNMTGITLPGSVSSIGRWAFSYCFALEKIVILNPYCQIDDKYGSFGAGKAVIYGYPNSTAQAYAEKYDYQFSALDGEPDNPFKDIFPNDYYYVPALWASEKGITNGKPGGIFAPLETCTRAQAVTFLWRAAGCPEPQSTAQRFPDVPLNDTNEFFYKAVAWAVEQGITNGRPNGKFCPMDPVNRSEFVTFLWRAEGKPKANATVSFKDIDKNEFYYDAVMWAVEKGITNGKPGNRFDPLGRCIRGEVVTFLYRYFA